MKLSICIPTHHGRAGTLRLLLGSIVRQSVPDPSQVEICISDNASNDGTGDMVEAMRGRSPFSIRYFRSPVDMRGVRNFLKVVSMASGEYCWMIGSDDVVLAGALEAVLAALEKHAPTGATVNKLNLDHELARFVGPDASVIVPRPAHGIRTIDGVDAVVSELGMLFTYMSTHVFRRSAWQAVVEEEGLDRLLWTRHFPHTYVLTQIAKRAGSWLWIGRYCVVQRLGNYALLEEKAHRESLYAVEVLEDLEKVWSSVLSPSSRAYRSLMRRHYLLYWNPFSIRGFMTEPAMTRDEFRALRTLAIHSFRGLLVFWLTGFPLLMVPRGLLRSTKKFTSVPSKEPGGSRSGVLRTWLRKLRITNRWTEEFDLAERVAREDIASRYNAGG